MAHSTTACAPGSWPRLSLVRKGLFTHEDNFNFHKTFGFSCLLHFAIRTRWLLDDMAFDASLLTPCCVLMHATLSLSSLIFKLPKVRIKEGSRIWPEFRLHSIVFACRSLATMLLTWTERRFNTGPHYAGNVVIIFATLFAADFATNSVDPKSRSPTIRGLDTTPIYKYCFSFLQFLGTTGCLVGLRAFAAQFSIVFIIQTYAFTLTLRRKNLVSHQATIILYSGELMMGLTVATLEMWRAGGGTLAGGIDVVCMFIVVAVTAMALRITVGFNKYVMWAIVSALVQLMRRCTPIVPPEQRIAGWPSWGWPVLFAAALCFFFLQLRQRVLAAQQQQQVKEVEVDPTTNPKAAKAA